MIMLDDVSLLFGQQIVFDKISANINKSNRIGLVGRNGSGKSTLLKVIAGTQGIDSGTVSIEKNATIGYMPQEVVLQSNKTVFQEALSAFGEVGPLLEELRLLEARLGDDDALERYSQINNRLLELNAAAAETETRIILTGLGFAPERVETQLVSSLSVGWRMRVVLAKLLLQKADFYLFDEPTNHLDIVTKDWFLQFLKNASFGFLLVCHDRYFLDHLCEKTFELEGGKGTLFHGNYTFYAEQKEVRAEVQEQAAIKQQREITKKMKTVERFRASASKAKMAQAMLKRIEKIDRVDTAKKERSIAFSFPPVERSGKVVLKVQDVAHSFVKEAKVIRDISFEVERGERVAIVAPNGVGKTTLFNLITGKLLVQEGSIDFGYNVSTAFFEQDQDKVLDAQNTIYEEVERSCNNSEARAKIRKFLGAFLFSGESVDKKVAVLSGGERNRVAMVKVLLKQANFLLLDEPTNHLDIQSKEILLNALVQFKGTILFVSHDRDFLDKLATRILELSKDKVISYPGNYESYVYHKSKESAKQEKSDKKQNSKPAKAKNNNDYELRKTISRLESKIDKLEKEIERLNALLGTCEYGTELFDSTYKKVKLAQEELEKAVFEWEELSS